MSSLGKSKTTLYVLIVLIAGAGIGGYFLGNYFPMTTGETPEVVMLKIGGSSTVTPLVNASLTKFHEFYPNILITLEMTDSGTGVTQTNQSLIDIGMSSKTWGANNQYDNLYCWKIAKDGICVIVNIPGLANGYLNLTKGELNGIYNGSIKNWAWLNGNNSRGGSDLPDHAITIIIREAGSGTRENWEDFINGTKGFLYDNGKYGNTVVTQNENPLVQSAVINTPYSIGYVGFAYTTGAMVCNVSTSKSVTEPTCTNFVTPTLQNIVDNIYQPSRTLWLMTKAPTRPAASSAVYKFIEFMMSLYGAQCILAGGGVPLSPLPSSIVAEDHWNQGYD